MASIYLIRHGQASFGQQNYDCLSDVGELQARHLGKKLYDRLPRFDAVCMGTMLRHRQTAEGCLEGMNDSHDQFTALDGWNEYDHENILAAFSDDFATPKGVENFVREQENPKKAFEKLFNDAMNRWMSGEHDQDYVESWDNFQNRVKDALKKTIEQHAGAKHIAVFTSGGPITLVSQYLLGVPPQNIMQMNWTLVNCGVTKLVTTGSRLFLSTLNEHTHFEGDDKHLISYK